MNPIQHRVTRLTKPDLVLYAYAHSQHMLDYALAKATLKQEKWDEHWRYQPSKERN